MSQAKEYIVKVKAPRFVDGLIQELAGWNVRVSNVSKVGFVGFTANMGTLISKWFKNDSRIEAIEPTTTYELQTVQPITSDTMWYLDRIDQANLPLNGNYSYSKEGDSVTIYTVDSGVSFNHVELVGKVSAVYDPNFPTIVFDPVIDQRIYDNDSSYNEAFVRGADELGHGTFVAGLAVSPTYGVAKSARIRSAKVFGQTTTSSGRILAGLNAVHQDYIALGKPSSIVNLSFGSIAESVNIVATGTTATKPSSFSINSMNVSLVTGTVTEMVTKINSLAIDGLVASSVNSKLVISIKKLGSVTLTDGTNSPLASIGITPGTYSNLPNLVEQAIISMAQDGMHFAISAGNYGIDSSLISPARIGAIAPVIVVGAVDKTDKLANFTSQGDSETTLGNISFTNLTTSAATASCFGPVVDLYAPGVSMESTWLNSYNTSDNNYNETMISSGTSFATPLVAGAMSIALSAAVLTPALLKSVIINGASSGVITGLPSGSNNKLLNITEIDTSIVWVNSGPFNNLAWYSYYELFLYATSFSGPASSYTIVSGSLPEGLVLETATGRIYGTISNDNSVGQYLVDIKAHNGYNSSPSDSNGVFTVSFGVVQGTIPAKWNTDSNLGSVREGDLVNFILDAENVASLSTPIVFSVVGNLPYGWVLVGNQVIGTAPMATNGDIETGFTINAYDGFTNTSKSFTLTILQNKVYGSDNEPYWITPTGILGSVVEGSTVSIQLRGIDQQPDPQPLTYNLEIGTGDGSYFGPYGELPPGLSLDPATGIISGQVQVVPDDIDGYEFAVFLSDGANVVANLFSIIVYKQHLVSSIIWDTPTGNLGSYYQNDDVNLTLLAHDTANLTINYFIASGEFPEGLTLNNNGTITGTITENVDKLYVFTVYASNGYNYQPSTFTILTNKINVAPEWVTESNLGNYPEGSYINILLIANDPDGDLLTFTSSDLPEGLYIESNFLRGTLNSVDADTLNTFHITVSDILSNPTTYLEVEQEFTLTITDGALNPNSPPIWLTPEGPLPSGINGQVYSTSVIAVDPENSILIYNLANGELPPGLLLDHINGSITGTIDLISQDTGYDFTISVTDGVFTVERSFNIFVSSVQVNQPPVWVTSPNLGSITAGDPTSIYFVANDPEGTVVTYSFISGFLPTGMLFNSASGQLSGIPSNSGTSDTVYQFTIRATDFNLAYVDQQFTITVTNTKNISPVWITPSGQLTSGSTLIEYHPGQYVNFQFQAVDPDNGPLPLTYRLSYSSSLPYGLTVSSSGLLSGYVGDVYSTQEIGFIVEIMDGVAVVPRNFVIKFVPTPAYGGTTCDLYVPLSIELVHMLEDWNTTDLIPDSVLYQPDDPKFGRASQYDVLITNNLHADNKDQIQNILADHHKKFSCLMGIPTYAVGRNNYGQVDYEVIYIPLLDPQKGTDFNIANDNGLEYYSHSFQHIRQEVKQIDNNEFLPAWMRLPQDDTGKTLGYVPAIVLAYVQPGKAQTIVQTFTQIINQTSFNIQETTFDRHVLLGEKINPTVTVGSQMSVGGVLVTFTGSDVYSAKNDIEQALSNAGNNEIRVYLEETVQYNYVGSVYTPSTGYSIRFNYASNFITLSNVSGTPCEELGFLPQSNIETTFDGQLVHFDYSLILDEKQNIQADGLTFVGKELLFDRYVGKFSNGQLFQIKWAPDYQEVFYNGLTKEFWSANPPIWITPPGELGYIATGKPVTIQLRTKHHLVDQIVSYELVFGSLPPGFTLNSDTGIITGVAGAVGTTTFFTIRAHDKWGNYKDRGFTLTVDNNILRIKQFIVLIDGNGIKI